jgi:uncharacterized protein YnzC (UPF0291/DUF896 family)
MSMNPALNDFESDMLRRVVNPQRAGWTRDAAESILALSPEDMQRATFLAEKSGAEGLSDDEQREMAGFRHVGRFLELLKSRARLSLKALNAA